MVTYLLIFQIFVLTVTTSSTVHIVPPRGYFVSKRIIRVLRDQPQSSSSYSSVYNTEPKRDGSVTAISSYSPGPVYPVSTYPADSAYRVGSSIRVGSVYPASTGYSVNQAVLRGPYTPTVSSLPEEYAQYQLLQLSKPSYSYFPYFASTVAPQSSAIASYRTSAGLPLSQASLNPEPYESFSAINSE